MDDRLRRARRAGDLELAAALAARAGGVSEGLHTLPGAGAGVRALVPSAGGALLATLSPAGAQVYDVAGGGLLYASPGATAVASDPSPLRVLTIDEGQLRCWTPAEGERTLLERPGAPGALSADARWVAFVEGRGVELWPLDEAGALGAPQRLELDRLGEQLSENDYDAELARVLLAPGEAAPTLVALGAETRDEYCCSSEWHTHYRSLAGALLFVAGAWGSHTLREDGDFLSEELAEAVDLAAPLLVGETGLLYADEGLFGLGPAEHARRAESAAQRWFSSFSNESLELPPGRLLALAPRGSRALVLRGELGELALVETRDEQGDLLPWEDWRTLRSDLTYQEAGGPAAFSACGQAVAWVEGQDLLLELLDAQALDA